MNVTPAELARSAELTIYVVRMRDTHQLAGIFVLPEGDDLALHVDEVADVGYCEYAVLPRLALLWEDASAPPFPDYLDGEDSETASIGTPGLGDLMFDIVRKVKWQPFVNGWVYFVRAGERVKIGHSLNVDARLTALQTGSPYKLELLAIVPGTVRDEAGFHRKFAALREHGEWFRYEGDLREYLESFE